MLRYSSLKVINDIFVEVNEIILANGKDLSNIDTQTVWLITKKFIDAGMGFESILKTLSTPFACVVLPQVFLKYKDI